MVVKGKSCGLDSWGRCPSLAPYVTEDGDHGWAPTAGGRSDRRACRDERQHGQDLRDRHRRGHRTGGSGGDLRGVPAGGDGGQEGGGDGARAGPVTQVHRVARGRIWVKSQSGEGSSSRSPYRSAMNELILIVEDNPKNLKLVRDTLQVKGYQTVETDTGEEGVQLARERRPALILMDIQLPGMNGIEALRELRADPMTQAIPVIAVTASVMAQTLDAVKRLLLRESQVQPLLLIVEDLHWIDSETQALLDGL